MRSFWTISTKSIHWLWIIKGSWKLNQITSKDQKKPTLAVPIDQNLLYVCVHWNIQHYWAMFQTSMLLRAYGKRLCFRTRIKKENRKGNMHGDNIGDWKVARLIPSPTDDCSSTHTITQQLTFASCNRFAGIELLQHFAGYEQQIAKAIRKGLKELCTISAHMQIDRFNAIAFRIPRIWYEIQSKKHQTHLACPSN